MARGEEGGGWIDGLEMNGVGSLGVGRMSWLWVEGWTDGVSNTVVRFGMGYCVLMCDEVG